MFTSRNFEIDEEEWQAIDKWNDEHPCKYKPAHGMKKYAGAIGGSLSITFLPTSIGEIITVKCGCGAELTVREL